MNFKRTGANLLKKYASAMPQKRFYLHLLIAFTVALLLRIAAAYPALCEPTALLRPDSAGYWNPACALASGDGLVTHPGSDTPEVMRPVGYIAWLASGILLGGESIRFAALMGILISAATVFPVAWGARKLCASERAGVAAWLWSLSITSIAVSPLILADTLLAAAAAVQFCAAVYFLKDKNLRQFALLTLAAIAGALIKPVNLPVVLFGVPVILLSARLPWRELGRAVLIYLILSCSLLLPYWVRNHALCGDFDGNTANLYFHNGSALMARATGESSEVWRKRLLHKADTEFAEHPEKYPTHKEQNRWKKAQYRQLISEYPLDAAIVHLPNIFNLMPDVPSLLENNRITAGERGTMAVLRQQGFFAAVDHYLNGRWYIMIIILPLLAVYAVTMLAMLWQCLRYLRSWQWQWLLLIGVQIFYYWLAPGPVISGRYLLPALPMLTALAAQSLLPWKNKKENSENSNSNISKEGAL